MALTVHKFEVPKLGTNAVAMPIGAKVVHVDIQNDTCMLWAIVNPDAIQVQRLFYLATTGEPLPEHPKKTHLGTVIFSRIGFVAHLFELE